jgi:hypothetical protein
MINLSLNILDIAQNSVRAKASEIFIGIRELKCEDLFEITVKDNGSGISKTILAEVTDPFVTTRTTRKTGLGLPLLKYHARLAGGDLDIDSTEGQGTQVKATFMLSHIDRQPLGDIAGVVTILIAANPKISFIYSHLTDKGEYCFSSEKTKEYLEVDTFNDYGLLGSIREMIIENLTDIGVSDMK